VSEFPAGCPELEWGWWDRRKPEAKAHRQTAACATDLLRQSDRRKKFAWRIE